jgi:hypothetical protein
MAYSVELSESALRELGKLDPPHRKRILKFLQGRVAKLDNPLHPGGRASWRPTFGFSQTLGSSVVEDPAPNPEVLSARRAVCERGESSRRTATTIDRPPVHVVPVLARAPFPCHADAPGHSAPKLVNIILPFSANRPILCHLQKWNFRKTGGFRGILIVNVCHLVIRRTGRISARQNARREEEQ